MSVVTIERRSSVKSQIKVDKLTRTTGGVLPFSSVLSLSSVKSATFVIISSFLSLEVVIMAFQSWVLLGICICFISASASVQNKVTDNPADQLVVQLNNNRTAHKSKALYSNPGLACIALQYIKAYQGDCNAVGDGKKPFDSEFAETFAPNCGVEAKTLAPVTGRLLGCQTKYIKPADAFSDILMKNGRSLEILYSNHTEIGAAVSGSDGGSPYFWCVLFSNGTSNGSFVLEGGMAKISRPGCFSGANDDCSGANAVSQTAILWSLAFGALIIYSAFWL